MALLTQAVIYCGHNVHPVMAAASRLIPSSTPNSPQHIVSSDLSCDAQECKQLAPGHVRRNTLAATVMRLEVVH
ncbi:hypothetical protein Pyn_22799 [Prunus yedoensis var. nudiflora]|uniref:Uncharacterized protein n=1 Tax=Prunus yedoensis var. nudiflora TaxID=2094558 RepID=A0A314XPM7_PRUYE|nr:hypothetical protein Pyn_22799 [Prunus yedoensis var. nudiflora]